MPLNLRGSEKLRNFNVPVSYRVHEKSGKFLDARNVNSIQGRLDTRFGTSRYNAESLGGIPRSLSVFTKSDGSTYLLALVGTELISVSMTGSHTVIKTGLGPTSIHRGDTENDRHIIAISGDDYLYSWNGTVFTRLGQKAPSKPTYAMSSGGSLVVSNKYKVAITFYASSIGFESSFYGFDDNNVIYSSESGDLTISSPNRRIDLTDIPVTAENALVDKVLIYLKDVTNNGEYYYVGEVTLGETTFSILEEPLSSQTPPEKNGVHPTGGAQFIEFFNGKLVTYGNRRFPNEARFSEENVPDAFNPFDDQLTLVIKGKGGPTGLALGLFSDSHLDPFLVFFKRKSTHVYSEIGGSPKFATISDDIGCISHETIQVKNGVIYFLSEEGWRAIANGRFVTNDQDEAITLGNGDIDDIFKSNGYAYGVNRSNLNKAFSVYYPTLDQYITWVAEGTNFAFSKAYVYEFDVGGFKPYEFAVPATCAVLGEDADGRDIVLFGTSDGYILKHSILENRSDRDSSNNEVAIPAYAVLPWLPDEGDFDATYNYRELILKAITSEYPLTVKNYIDYNLSTEEATEYDFSSPLSGFVLDQDALDEGTLGDERGIVTSRADINRVGESLAIGFYQEVVNANMGLVSLQIDSSKNGNRNRPSDSDDEDGTFDEDTGTYFPSASESVQLAAHYAQLAQQAAAAVSVSDGADVDRATLANNASTSIPELGEYLAGTACIIIEYYLYRRTESGSKRMSGQLRLEGIPDASTNPGKWELFEERRSESGGESGVSFSLDDIDTEKSIVVATLDNMAGANHECTIYWKISKLLTGSSTVTLTNNSANTLSAIGTYLSLAKGVIVDYYIYRRNDAGYKRMSGKIFLEGIPDGATNPDKWGLWEAERSERDGDIGITFSLDDVDTEKSVLVATLNNLVGAGHSCIMYYKLTELLV
jgi:hypothetical protein